MAEPYIHPDDRAYLDSVKAAQQRFMWPEEVQARAFESMLQLGEIASGIHNDLESDAFKVDDQTKVLIDQLGDKAMALSVAIFQKFPAGQLEKLTYHHAQRLEAEEAARSGLEELRSNWRLSRSTRAAKVLNLFPGEAFTTRMLARKIFSDADLRRLGGGTAEVAVAIKQAAFRRQIDPGLKLHSERFRIYPKVRGPKQLVVTCLPLDEEPDWPALVMELQKAEGLPMVGILETGETASPISEPIVEAPEEEEAVADIELDPAPIEPIPKNVITESAPTVVRDDWKSINYKLLANHLLNRPDFSPNQAQTVVLRALAGGLTLNEIVAANPNINRDDVEKLLRRADKYLHFSPEEPEND